jgi:predicted alpha/beta-fold hydrolase
MGTNMKGLAERHHEAISKNPDLSLERIRNVTYLHEFDREVQGPTWGYPTEGAYYRDSSSVDSLMDVRIPLFAINAEDDPVSTKSIYLNFADFLDCLQGGIAVPRSEANALRHSLYNVSRWPPFLV